MFCSRCGKTLNPEAPNCTHCGAAVGESRMGGHTSVQTRYTPQEQKREQARYTPYTKTTYTSMDDTGGDVYSRTSYRPVLAVDNAPEADEAELDAAASGGEPVEDGPFPGLRLGDSEVSPHQRASLEKLQAVPQDAPAPEEAQKILEKELDIRVRPPKPIRKTGISPEVEEYIQRMEALKNRSRKKQGADEAEPQSEEAASGDDLEATAQPADERLARKAEKERDKALRQAGPARKWIKRIVAVAAIAVVMVGGLVYLALMTQPKSPIEGVSKQLYDDGLKLIATRITEQYRANIINLFKSDATGQSALAQQSKDMEEIQALKSDAPMENDAKFVETLAEIQKSVNTATTTDALAALDPDQTSTARTQMVAQSAEQWAIIDNAIKHLEMATAIIDLNSIVRGVDEVNATPVPSPTPEVDEYPNLKRSDKNQAVKNLQTRLAELGWFTGVKDGKFGSYTQQTVRRFQQAAGLEVTGIATNEMQQLLYSDDAPVFTPGAQVGGAPQSVTSGSTDAAQDGQDGGQTAEPVDDTVK